MKYTGKKTDIITRFKRWNTGQDEIVIKIIDRKNKEEIFYQKINISNNHAEPKLRIDWTGKNTKSMQFSKLKGEE